LASLNFLKRNKHIKKNPAIAGLFITLIDTINLCIPQKGISSSTGPSGMALDLFAEPEFAFVA